MGRGHSESFEMEARPFGFRRVERSPTAKDVLRD